MRVLTFFCLGSLLTQGVFASEEDELVVTTTTGRVRGTWSKSFEDNGYMSFYSIPYAKPPVGLLRFAVREL